MTPATVMADRTTAPPAVTLMCPAKDTPAPRNTRLWHKLRDVEKLPPGDREAVLKFVDALLVRQRDAGGAR